MEIRNPLRFAVLRGLSILFVFSACGAAPVLAQRLVPGTGQLISQVGDDFEDEEWSFNDNWPKSSYNIDKQQRLPAGQSKNGRWYEGVKRGHPDIIRRVATPDGGLPGSKGALLLQSRHTGIPGRPSFQMQQDDFIADVMYRMGGTLPARQAPSVVARVFLPPIDQWEQRTGPTFAFRVALDTTINKPGRGLFRRGGGPKTEVYWPGMFVEFVSKATSGLDYDTARIRIRADGNGGDYAGPQITQSGWWTMGISVTGDGQVHYYAKPGIEDLTAADHIASEFPYGYRAEHFRTFFFNVCNRDDGRTLSTAWIVDDPKVYRMGF